MMDSNGRRQRPTGHREDDRQLPLRVAVTHAARRAVMGAHPERLELVQALSQRVLEGSYDVDAARVARAIARNLPGGAHHPGG
ncbi:MAG: flagellar biosynthesis anti-sigma factor FlgM [Nitrospirota bacterium]|nr:flagellar biosynthesis anti-sigma factor FlgM [Nitrospirota bacterium]